RVRPPCGHVAVTAVDVLLRLGDPVRRDAGPLRAGPRGRTGSRKPRALIPGGSWENEPVFLAPFASPTRSHRASSVGTRCSALCASTLLARRTFERVRRGLPAFA